LYAFGHGLSYTSFDYSNLTVSKETMSENDILTVSFTVKNSGSSKGMETVQVYVEDVEASVPRPVKELKAFKKVELNEGEAVHIQVSLARQAFAFWNPDTKDWTVEKGKFVIHVGTATNDIRLSKEIVIN
jgi:beta-glucosidase